MASDNVKHLDADNFQEAIAEDTPILVDFWAVWCGPCQAVAPVIEELADQMEGKVRFGKLDIDKNRDVASQFDIRGVPTFILFQNGEIKDRLTGNRPKAAFEQFLSQHVA